METRIKKVFKAGLCAWTVCALFLTCLVIPALGEDSVAVSSRSDLAVVKDVTFSRQGKGELIAVTSDRPLVYSYYRLTNPLRAVVDLAQSDPGTYTAPIIYEGGYVKQVRLIKHELASGMLTRMELFLVEGADFSVKLSPGDKRKLIISVTSATTPPVIASPPSSELLEKSNGSKSDPAPAVTSPAPAAEERNSAPSAVAVTVAAPAGAVARKLTEMVVTSEGIDIVTDAPVKTFKSFPMAKPDRLVIDLPGVRNGIKGNRVPINAFGIEIARLGEHEGKSRIVFEGTSGAFQRSSLIKTEKGLRLLPTTPGAVPAKQVDIPVAAAPRKGRGTSTTSTVESLDFGVVDTGSRITMKVTGSCVAEKPSKNSEGVTFLVKQCILPRTLQRTIDTSAFPSVVQAVIPYQVSVKGAPETRILVKLNRDADYSLRQDDGTVTLDFTHPKLEKQVAAASAPKEPLPVVETVATAGPATSIPQPNPVVATQAPVVSPTPAIATSEAAAKKLQESAQAAPGAKKNYTGRRVTLEFVDADIRKIFQLIAEVSNLNILIGDDVSGTITIKLVNVPWDQALDMILEIKDLGMKADGNIVQIKPRGKFKTAADEVMDAKKTRDKMMELQTRVFDINYAQSSDVVSQFKTLSSGRSDSTISSDERTNKVIVTDIAPAIARMKKLLDSIDVAEQQVMIEARIVEASAGFTRDLGVQWGIHYKDASGSFMGINRLDTGFGGATTPPPLVGTSGPGMATGISFGTLTSNINVDLRLSAAATAELIKIISTPKIATINNKPAKITQGQSIPYQNTTANTGAVTQFVEAALTLEVTPHITPDGSVMMKIKASNNSPGVGNPPPINKKEATTELVVKSGETTVIGGIYIDNDSEGNSGVPYLMDIPWLGWLFKSNTKTKTKTELLIFITPRIIT